MFKPYTPYLDGLKWAEHSVQTLGFEKTELLAERYINTDDTNNFDLGVTDYLVLHHPRLSSVSL